MDDDLEDAGIFKTFERLIIDGDVEKVKNHILENRITEDKWLNWKKNDLSCGDNHWDIKTPVFLAAELGHLRVMRTLIEAGFDAWRAENVDVNGMLFDSPMSIACYKGNMKVIRTLVEEYAVGVNFKAYINKPLWYAIVGNHFEPVQYLSERGACLIFKDPCHRSALSLAASKGNSDMCELFISLGVDVNVCNISGKHVLCFAVESRSVDTVRVLVEGGSDVNTKSENGTYALIEAARLGLHEIVRFLGEHEANPYLTDKHGCTALHHAIRRRSLETVYVLVVDINMRPLYHKFCLDYLYLALTQGSESIVSLLMNTGFPTFLIQRYRLSNMLDMYPSIIDLLNKVLRVIESGPKPLKELCCFQIRRSLGQNITKIDCLPLPTRIKNFILLKHLTYSSISIK